MKILKFIKIIFSLLFIVSCIGIITLFVLFSLELKHAGDKINNLPNLVSSISRPPSKIISEDGKDLFLLSTEYRKPVRFQNIPKLITNATIAAEDRRFYDHKGIDYFSMFRVVFTNIKSGSKSQGGSTLTMQIAKRLYHSSEKTFQRKFKDIALAVIMERELSKEQILEIYLNQVYYGAGAYGIQAAAEVYFDKKLDEITLPEAALLARLVKLPSIENPFVAPEKSIENRNYVLKSMYEENMINLDTYKKAIKTPLKLRKNPRVGNGKKLAPYFVDYILDIVKHNLNDVDLSEGGYKIETTLNYKIQNHTDYILQNTINKNKWAKINTGAFLLLDKDGNILTMCGGPNYNESQYNGTTQARRQPGSAFKPFIYALGLETGKLTEKDMISNERYSWIDPITKVEWAPRNASGKYGGEANISAALTHSLNMPVIRAAESIGVRNIISLSKSLFSLPVQENVGLSIGLGCTDLTMVELAKGYSTFMLGGSRLTPIGLKRVIGPDGRTLYEFSHSIKQSVISSFTANYIDDSLRSAVVHGTSKRVAPVLNARGKTGTTNNFTDAWFCGYTNELLGVAWLANSMHAVTGMNKVFGGTIPSDMWREVMRYAQKEIKEQETPLPVKYYKPIKNAHRDLGEEDGVAPESVTTKNAPSTSIEPSLPLTPLSKENKPAWLNN